MIVYPNFPPVDVRRYEPKPSEAIFEDPTAKICRWGVVAAKDRRHIELDHKGPTTFAPKSPPPTKCFYCDGTKEYSRAIGCDLPLTSKIARRIINENGENN